MDTAYYLVCDICGDEHEQFFYTWEEAKGSIHDIGWIMQKDEQGEWENICPSCRWQE